MELKVSGLACARGGVVVLQGMDFGLAAGQALVIRGPNGSGKTTLLRTLAGLQPPVSGQITAPEDAIAYLGHADGMKSTLTAAENLAFWAKLHDTDAGEDALAAFELAALAGRPAGNLSAGQRRRLGLARMLVTGRPIWLFDEPTVSLDSAAVSMFASAIRAHLASGGSALIATHIDLGLPEAQVLDISRFRARAREAQRSAFDEAVE